MNNQTKLGLLVDVETTGLSPKTDEIIELALKLFSYNEETGEIVDIVDQESYLREPVSNTAKRNYSNAFRIHGIPYESVAGKSFYDVKIKTFFNRTDTVFAHNASFDRSFLYYMYPQINDLKWYCTMKGVPWKNYGFSNSKLLTLLESHNITNYQTHRAMDDITYLMELLKKTNPYGDPYLREVLRTGHMRKYQPADKKRSLQF
ncbi:DNA polymerase III subunit epsilon [Bacillus sp. M6-12]|uniref:exonuclease domain-containing protein n=1 Tax=Bacillus sp. M6-12 TaxID=2054166 RepID=UPI000C763B5C|nr:exonuclease domain-containing protein [Bacillus sp. M6-12]PLS16146.1 DNA polymerase III subunit epsilon [Bacillus sp. M6-12]